MSKRSPNDFKVRARKVETLASGETLIRERLLEMRGELDQVADALDRLTCQPPKLHAGMGPLSGLNLLPFPRSCR